MSQIFIELFEENNSINASIHHLDVINEFNNSNQVLQTAPSNINTTSTSPIENCVHKTSSPKIFFLPLDIVLHKDISKTLHALVDSGSTSTLVK